jgi:hypothetical protein
MIPVSCREDILGCETSRLPHFLDSRFTGDGMVVSLCADRALLSGKFLVFISLRGRIESRTTVRLEELGQLGKLKNL